jgi:hypothetical protein
LPTIKLNSSIDFNITQNGLRVPLLLCRERKDFKVNSDIIYIVALAKSNNLEIIFDVNARYVQQSIDWFLRIISQIMAIKDG